MGERIDRVVRAIQCIFEGLSVHVQEERVIRYIVNHLLAGRRFDEVLRDPYVMNNTDSETRSRMLLNPAVLRSIEAEIMAEFHDYRRAVADVGEKA